MRTMFISLVVIWSLAQLPSADSSTRINNIVIAECKTTYTCYIPERCTSQTDLTFEESRIINVRDDARPDELLLNDDCEAIIRFHNYAQHLTFVVIESFNAAITSIEFFEKDDKFKFECIGSEVPGEPDSGKYAVKPKYAKTVPMTEKWQNLKCEFQVALPKTRNIFNPPFSVKFNVKEKINGQTIDKHMINFERFPDAPDRCDPKTIKDGSKADRINTKVFNKIQYKLEKIYCDDISIYTMEFRQDSSKKFERVENIECKKYTVNSNVVYKYALKLKGATAEKVIDKDDTLELRCVADAKYFCKYGVNVKPGKENLTLHSYEFTEKKASTLTCTPDKPHLVIEDVIGFETPIQDAKFECVTIGEKPLWTVKNNDGKVIPLEEDGPTVYCTKDLDCKLHLKILENAVISGYLDEKEFVPMCFAKGELNVIDGSKETKIDTPYCNLKTGKYEYKELENSNRTQTIKGDTKFKCEYVKEVNEVQYNKDTQTMVAGSIAGFIGAGLLGAAAIAAFVYFAKRSHKKTVAKLKAREEQQRADGHGAWMVYCIDEEEMEEYKKNNPDEKSFKEKTIDQWNKMLMNYQRKAREISGPIDDMAKPRQDKQHWFKAELLSTDTEGNQNFGKVLKKNTRKRAPEVIGRYEQHIKDDTTTAGHELVQPWNKALDALKKTLRKENTKKRRNYNRLWEEKDMPIPPIEVPLVRLDQQ